MKGRAPVAARGGLPRRVVRAGMTGLAIGAVSLLLLEGVARLIDPVGISYYPETARYLDTLIRDEPLGYRNRPGLRGRFYGVPVEINAAGLRDREVETIPAPGEFRIAVLGDSFPFGIGVPAEQSVPAVIERLLGETAPPGTVVRTLNFGVPSYNTEQELAQFETVGERLHPRAAVLFFALNDIYPRMWVFEKRTSWLTNVAQRSYAVSLLFFLQRGLRATPPDPGASMATQYRADNPRWQAIDRSLSALQARCRASGIPLVVFTYDDKEREAMALVAAVGAREGFPVIPLSPAADPRWKDLDRREYANSPVDSHPNRKGCEIYGTLVAEALLRSGSLPWSPPPGD